MTVIKVGSRKSPLAMWQTYYVQDRLEASGLTVELTTMETIGDKVLDTSIAKIGSKGVFTEELEQQLADGSIDIAVHSAKDMPSILPDVFELIAFTDREQSGDVLLSTNKNLDIDDTSKDITIGTSSVRRRALLNRLYPHIKTVDIRGNLQTRVAKMKEGLCDGILLAFAGVHRMDMEDMIVKHFDKNDFIPPVGQGCIAIESAATISDAKRQLIRDCLNNPDSESCLLAERAFLRTMEGGCSIPAFAMASLSGDEISITGGLVSLDGQTMIKDTVTGDRANAIKLGEMLGLATLNNGGKELLAEIRKASD
jgi:hydroxymethylbilane synthase